MLFLSWGFPIEKNSFECSLNGWKDLIILDELENNLILMMFHNFEMFLEY